MTEPIDDPAYWRGRMLAAPRDQPHQAVYCCTLGRWQAIEAKHREILAATIGPGKSILDAGCGWGRLLDLLPADWCGAYLGLDLCPDFVDMAQGYHPMRTFRRCDLRDLSTLPSGWNWAVLVSVRPMVVRNLGPGAWAQMERELRRVAKRLLYLEYDETDPGSVE